MIIPDDYDLLVDWTMNNPFDAADAIVNLRRGITERDEFLRRLLAEAQWMSGSPDFGPGGTAERGWTQATQPLLTQVQAFLSANE